MYGNVVLGVEHHSFEEILELHKSDLNLESDTQLKAEHWKKVIEDYKAKVEEEIGKPFPQDPKEQLWGAIGAVFGSWNIPRAVTYRKINNIPEDWGTAVNVQAMVFGNMGDDCATGVAFTRNPSTGAKEFYGEYLVNAQGEDVVAGIRTPQQVTIAGKKANNSTLPAMEEVMPTVFKQLDEVRQQLEKHYRDMQDIEFTVQQGKLYMLQTRNGKRTAAAALKIAVDLCSEGADRRGDRGGAHRSRLARPAAAPDPRSQGQEGSGRARPAGQPRRRLRPGRLHRRRGGGPRLQGRTTSSWCGSRPARKTSTACTPRSASLPPAAA